MLSPWLTYDPKGEISLFYMEGLMVGSFSPTFPSFSVETLIFYKKLKKQHFFTYLITISFELMGVFIGYDYECKYSLYHVNI